MSSVHNSESVRTQTSDGAGAPAFVSAIRTYPNAKGELVETTVVQPVMTGTFATREYLVGAGKSEPIDVPALAAQATDFLKQPWPPGVDKTPEWQKQVNALQLKATDLFAYNEGKVAQADGELGIAAGGTKSGNITLS